MSNQNLKTQIKIKLSVPVKVVGKDGKSASRDEIILSRPKLAQAKRLAIIIGPQFIKGLMNEADNEKSNQPDMKSIIVDVIEGLATGDGLDELIAIIAEMSGETVEVLNDLDWLDIIPVVSGFLGFFPTLQLGNLTKSVQT